MRDEYDFSKAVKNPYKTKLGQNNTSTDSPELKIVEKMLDDAFETGSVHGVREALKVIADSNVLKRRCLAKGLDPLKLSAEEDLTLESLIGICSALEIPLSVKRMS